MSTMTKAGIPVDTGFAKRQHEQLSELAEYEEQGYKQVRAWSEKIEVEI